MRVDTTSCILSVDSISLTTRAGLKSVAIRVVCGSQGGRGKGGASASALREAQAQHAARRRWRDSQRDCRAARRHSGQQHTPCQLARHPPAAPGCRPGCRSR